ncbi:MAG TPA: alpha/beta hydrolase [Candidatus Nitrosotalea sp.]|nr:alpha/beta hydrolase [Candidatus Nitrosotalea sp.]
MKTAISRRTRCISALVAALAASACASAVAQEATPATNAVFLLDSAPTDAPAVLSIRGSVTQANAPAKQAHVTIRDLGGKLIVSGATGIAGEFTVYGLTQGAYALTVSREGAVVRRPFTYNGTRTTVSIALPNPPVQPRLGALAAPAPPPPPSASPAPLYYISDRHVEPYTDVAHAFDEHDRAHPDQIYYGSVTGSTITPGTTQNVSDFLKLVADTARAQGRQSSLLIVVTGFNNDFADGVAAASDFLDFPGSVVLFSWPSKHGVMLPIRSDPSSYFNDETDNNWATADFRILLRAIVEDPNAPQSVSVVGHSMGTRLVADGFTYLHGLYPNAAPPHRFDQVIVAAGDVDSDVFAQQAVPAILSLANRLTIYRHSADGALGLSVAIHGHSRLGKDDSDFPLAWPSAVDIIEASIFDCPSMNHSYWTASATVHKDIEAALFDVDIADASRAAYLAVQPASTSLYAFANLPNGHDGQCTIGSEFLPNE